jgi:hypothetical protein
MLVQPACGRSDERNMRPAQCTDMILLSRSVGSLATIDDWFSQDTACTLSPLGISLLVWTGWDRQRTGRTAGLWESSLSASGRWGAAGPGSPSGTSETARARGPLRQRRALAFGEEGADEVGAKSLDERFADAFGGEIGLAHDGVPLSALGVAAARGVAGSESHA